MEKQKSTDKRKMESTGKAVPLFSRQTLPRRNMFRGNTNNGTQTIQKSELKTISRNSGMGFY